MRPLRELLFIQSRQLAVESGHHFQIVGDRAQLGGAAQFQFHAPIEIEGRGEIVRLDADQITAGSRFDQQKRINHLGRIGVLQEPFAVQSLSADELRVGQAIQKPGDIFLQRDIERAIDLQVKPVEVVEICDTEGVHHVHANRVGRLVSTR